MVFTRENRGGSAQHKTRAGPEEEVVVVVCTREIEGDPLLRGLNGSVLRVLRVERIPLDYHE